MILFGCVFETAADTVAEATIARWSLGGTFFDAASGGSPAVDGAGVGRWVADDGASVLSQSTSAKEPLYDTDLFPSRGAVIAAADQSLAGTVTLPATMAMVIAGGLVGTKVVLSLDTTATTTKPALALIFEDYFG